MTEAEKIQYDRFLAAGYDPDLAATLIGRGAWRGVRDASPEDISEINEYRRERDAARKGARSDVDRLEAA